MSSHKRTPSEADRWLEEVSKSVRVPQPNPIIAAAAPPTQPFPAPVQIPVAPLPSIAPVAFISPLPPTVPMLPPRQPTFHAHAPTSYPVANGLPFPQSSVPVVGITPSQMVANVFGSATQPQSFPAPASTTPQHDAQAVANISPFMKPSQPTAANPAHLQPSNGSMTFNGADNWSSPSQLATSSPATQPPQQPPDAFEAQWAALEGRSRQRTTPSPTNPFSTELHKTFEIQLWGQCLKEEHTGQ